jgi:hypothetical protein
MGSEQIVMTSTDPATPARAQRSWLRRILALGCSVATRGRVGNTRRRRYLAKTAVARPTALLLMTSVRIASALFDASPAAASSEPYILNPPVEIRPVPVRASFHLRDVNEIDDGSETFEFTGVLALEWHDPRLAFDPAQAGIDEKIVQGAFQFNEISPGWYPEIILVNEAGLFQKSGVIQRVRFDGTSTLIQTINAVAEVDLNMRRFPLDDQRLEAVFEVLGFDREEVLIEIGSEVTFDRVQIPQWNVQRIDISVRDRRAPYAGRTGVTSALVLTVDVTRQSWYARRLIVAPLVVIVLLSFAVFWMDESATLGDRLGVSFIGILTGVAYQMVIADQLPRISYFTLMHGFLGLSFMTMCATVVISLLVVRRHGRGDNEGGNRLDRRCRWAFPLGYFAMIATMFSIEYLIG